MGKRVEARSPAFEASKSFEKPKPTGNVNYCSRNGLMPPKEQSQAMSITSPLADEPTLESDFTETLPLLASSLIPNTEFYHEFTRISSTFIQY